MKTKIVSWLLVLALVLSMLPLTALAAESGAYWPNFRNSAANMAIVDTKTPTSAATTVEKWAKSFGSGWANSPSGLIIADNALIFMNMKSLKKVDLQTGELLKEAPMSASGGYVVVSPTYADGTVFCPLSKGKIEAFDAKTLESKWVFTDALGGQNNTPITYADGYLYTGYWNSETKDANYVCVDAATGSLVWSKTVTGGFYWAGSTVVGDAVIFGSDDGASGFSGDSHLFALNRKTGDVISDITLTGMGDQRSSMAYSAEKGRVYFSTKNGYIASAAVDAATGALSDLKSNKVAAQATSTPVVYGDKVFCAAGSGIVEGSNGAGNFIVADANTLEGLYAIPLLAYPQGSTLISTAYLAQTGKLYCYCTYNGMPGGLSLITLDPNSRTAEGAKLEEIYDAAGHEQYCLISPICGPDGTIYYRNDSGSIFAIGSNQAYLTAMGANVGKLNKEFAVSRMSYELVVPAGTPSVSFTATACEGGTLTLNGGEISTPVSLTGGKATAELTVTKGADSRTYTVSIREESGDAALKELKLNESNGYSSFKTLTPEYAPETYCYGFFQAGASRSFENIWPDANDPNASVKVYVLENVDEGRYDTATGEIPVTAKNSGHNRYAVYFADDTKPMSVRVEVTAEDGTAASYYVVMSKSGVEGGAALLQSYQDPIAAKAVDTIIGQIGEVTVHSADAIKAARAAYDALTDSQKALVSSYDTLTAAEAALEQAKAENTATPVKVSVTVSNAGDVVVAQQTVTVTDHNDNGWFDVDDTLYAIHEKAYEGGAAAGYASSDTQYGMSITKLWGDTSGSFGYWLDNASCWSLEDEVKEGGHVVAFVYADKTNYSDAYAKFDSFSYEAVNNKELSLTLETAGYDANWNTVFSGKAGAAITAYENNKPLNAGDYTVTDNGEGSYTVTFRNVGSYTLIAAGESMVPAVSTVAVSKNPDELAAEAVEAKIDAIGTVTLDSETAITAARTAYDALTGAQKPLVGNYETLTKAEAALIKLQEAAAQAAADQAAAEAVKAKIDAIGTVTLDSKAAITAARTAYDALTDTQKALVGNFETLTKAEAALIKLQEAAAQAAADQAAADAVKAKIGAIGTVTLDSKTAITAARTAYDALTDAQKALVSNYKTLTKAEKALNKLEKADPSNPVTGDEMNLVLFGSLTLTCGLAMGMLLVPDIRKKLIRK